MPTMGRRPSVNLNLPPRMRARKQRSGDTYYYYDAGGKPRREIPLGKVYTEAVRQWAELHHAEQHITSALITFKEVADRYQREVIPTKASRTQDDNIKELQHLLAFFNNPPAPLDEIKPLHVRQYLDNRTGHGKHSTENAPCSRTSGTRPANGALPIKKTHAGASPATPRPDATSTSRTASIEQSTNTPIKHSRTRSTSPTSPASARQTCSP